MIVAHAPNGKLIVESYERMYCAYPIVWEGSVANPEMEYSGGDRRLFDDDAKPVQQGGEDCYLDEDGIVWTHDQLVFSEAPDDD